ncbi:SPOR domain-containing protein [Arcobacter peruensis]|uniref:SPOR domain-containing protein n=1 Tax=Arcobacter peruensis TaxID=2320140 RepID=UPI000F0983C4|nr:SPOR domain-containing protein [Arcobacter peruensis]
MEIKGEEFIKKVQLQQERDELEQKLSELEEVQTSIGQNNTIQNESIKEPIDNELGNIMLDNPSSNEETNKKKYLILGLILVILFLLTIIVIRLLTDTSKEDTFTSNKTDPIETKTTTEDSNIEENFQKIMNERIKKDNVEKEVSSEEKINAINKEEIPEEVKTKTSDEILDETIKKIEAQIAPEKKVIAKKPVVKKVIKQKPVVKKETKKSVKELVNNISSSAPKGYFVQIGAFSKKPSNSYISKIKNANLKYKVHQVEVKGKIYNKVLIGPYSSRASANDNIENIKSKLNLSSAYILKF